MQANSAAPEHHPLLRGETTSAPLPPVEITADADTALLSLQATKIKKSANRSVLFTVLQLGAVGLLILGIINLSAGLIILSALALLVFGILSTVFLVIGLAQLASFDSNLKLLDDPRTILRFRQRVNGPRITLYVLLGLTILSLLSSLIGAIGG